MKQVIDFDFIKAHFPKKRPPLIEDLQKTYDKEYKSNRQSFLSQMCESWLHFQIKGRKDVDLKTLELGAGTLNHLTYEKWEDGKVYDIIEPKKFLYEDSQDLHKIRSVFADLNDLPQKRSYDRIISCAVLEHLTNLPLFLAKSAFLMTEQGYQSHSIPVEGYPTWQAAWFLFNFPKYKSLNKCKSILKHEHVNNYDCIYGLVSFLYKVVQVKFSYPLFVSPYVSFYASLTFSKPQLDVCEKVLKSFTKT